MQTPRNSSATLPDGYNGLGRLSSSTAATRGTAPPYQIGLARITLVESTSSSSALVIDVRYCSWFDQLRANVFI